MINADENEAENENQDKTIRNVYYLGLDMDTNIKSVSLY